MKTLDERVTAIERYLGLDEHDQEAGAPFDEPLVTMSDLPPSRAESMRDLTELPFLDTLPLEVVSLLPLSLGLEAAQRTAVAFLDGPGRVVLELTKGEWWWCILQGYSAMRSAPIGARQVGEDPEGLREPLTVAAMLGPLYQLAFHRAWYHGVVSGPKSPPATGPIVWPGWLPDPRGRS